MNLPTSQSEGEIQRLLSVTLLRLDHFTLFRLFPLEGALLYLKQGVFTVSQLLGNLVSLPCFALKREGVASSIVQQLCQSGVWTRGNAEVWGQKYQASD